MKSLSKAILAKMSLSEHKKLATLQAKSDQLGADMVQAQAVATIAMRKEGLGHVGKPSSPVQSLINKGFKAEFIAFKAADLLKAFKDTMRQKYLKSV